MNPVNPDTTSPVDPTLQRFHALLAERLAQGRWLRLVLAKPMAAAAADAEGADLQRVLVRPIVLKDQPVLSFVYSHTTRDITKNLPHAEGLARVATLLGMRFRNAHLFTPEGETQLTLSKKGKPHLSFHAAAAAAGGGDDAAVSTPAAPTTHDREKQRWLDLQRPFLVALGVTTAQHQLVPAMARKWKQINKFVEIFAHALAASPLADAQQLRVVDFGAGKAYLSFAVHDWLRHTRGLAAEVVGVELRPDLVAQGQRIVADLGLQGMQVLQGDVREWKAGAMNVMIALHACDTATDHAIHLGIRAGADIILCSPCCHKQLRPQLLSPHPLRSVFQHGIHAEQQAEMVTDSLRALLLDAQGYDTQVFEFVALEHTRKNKMILAVKRRTPKAPDAALAQVEELKRFFGVREQCLQTLLAADAA
jgi:Methyltransferase domain